MNDEPEAERTTRVGAVFVNFHSEEQILPRAIALRAAGMWVVVADNSGGFAHPEIPTVAMPSNVGFGAACNRAVAALPAEVDTVCFHNPDVDVPPGAVLTLVSRLWRVNDLGVVAPAEMVSGRLYAAGYAYPTPLREAALCVRGAIRLARSGDPAGESAGSVQGLQPHRSSSARRRGRRFPSGALLVVRRAAFESLGGFDERFFLYAEDLDLVDRFRNAGFTIEFHPEVVVVHRAGEGSSMSRGRRELLRWLGVEMFLAKSEGWRWRGARWVHQRFIGRLHPAWPVLVDAIQAEWSSGASPAEVMERVHPLLLTGGFRDGR